ncbi:hypothetical protein ACP4OV_027180 [Aristida adscensionis]
MEKGGARDTPAPVAAAWNFAARDDILGLSAFSVRGVLGRVKAGMVDTVKGGARAVVSLGQGDPSASPCFRTAPEAVDAVAAALRSGKHNCYAPSGVGFEPARRRILADFSLIDIPDDLLRLPNLKHEDLTVIATDNASVFFVAVSLSTTLSSRSWDTLLTMKGAALSSTALITDHCWQNGSATRAYIHNVVKQMLYRKLKLWQQPLPQIIFLLRLDWFVSLKVLLHGEQDTILIFEDQYCCRDNTIGKSMEDDSVFHVDSWLGIAPQVCSLPFGKWFAVETEDIINKAIEGIQRMAMEFQEALTDAKMINKHMLQITKG